MGGDNCRWFDDRLESLSDKARKGEAMGYAEALEVVHYQESLKRQRKTSFWQKVKSKFKIR